MGARKKKIDEHVISYSNSDDDFAPNYSKSTMTAIIVWIVIAGLLTYIKKIWIFLGVRELMSKLSDIFFIPGVVVLVIGIIVFAVGDGLFDGVGYSVKALRDIKSSERPQESYLDYKKRMSTKEYPTRPFFIVAGISLLLAILFTALYLNIK